MDAHPARRDDVAGAPALDAAAPSARGGAPTRGVDDGGAGSLARDALDHLDALHRFATYLTGSPVDAEDLVQDTYARALGAESSFVRGTNLRAWLFRILRNGFIDARRRARSAPLADDAGDDDGELARAPGGVAYPQEPLRGDVELEALRGAVAENIERALGELSSDARTVVLLDLEGFTETEVADVLGCAVGTVKSRLARARDALRKRLGEYRR